MYEHQENRKIQIFRHNFHRSNIVCEEITRRVQTGNKMYFALQIPVKIQTYVQNHQDNNLNTYNKTSGDVWIKKHEVQHRKINNTCRNLRTKCK